MLLPSLKRERVLPSPLPPTKPSFASKHDCLPPPVHLLPQYLGSACPCLSPTAHLPPSMRPPCPLPPVNLCPHSTPPSPGNSNDDSSTSSAIRQSQQWQQCNCQQRGHNYPPNNTLIRPRPGHTCNNLLSQPQGTQEALGGRTVGSLEVQSEVEEGKLVA